MDKQRVLASLRTLILIFYFLCISRTFHYVQAHGRLWEPVARSSMWRKHYGTPTNYQDNELYCGGVTVQYKKNGGKCGVCGDPYDGPRPNEVNGRFATGIIVRNYTEGQQVEAQVQLTANHKGWFMFTLCPKKKYSDPEPLDCFETHPLQIAGKNNTYKFPITADMKLVKVNLSLPKGLSCPYCVFRWKYNAGNSWGVDPVTNEGCIGCGNQEQFYGCADVTIFPDPNKTSSASKFTWNKYYLWLLLTAALVTGSVYSANI
ncbi:uncharacterized protein LOC115214156 [Octopus sinensis]|uniref:Uncharacterized protein LOC115214156 n=1 Tax=Octopus sinensis TaxID=2607531 RepID=A0A6P7SMD5_9MOLL|nr:uncharacterized protein LOC115214156 [Octopus sinensis]